jgi:hypothetical protein
MFPAIPMYAFLQTQRQYIIVYYVHDVFTQKITCLDLTVNQSSPQTRKDTGLPWSPFCFTTGWTTGVRSPAETKDFSSGLYVQTSSEAHPASCAMGTGDPFSGSKARPGRDADHSPPSSAEVKNE